MSIFGENWEFSSFVQQFTETYISLHFCPDESYILKHLFRF